MKPWILACLALAGCAGKTPTPAEQAFVVVDAADQKACVDKYNARAEIDACRAAVKARRFDGGGP